MGKTGGTYTPPQVARALNIPYRTIHHWMESGLLRPEGARRGTPHPATFRGKDLRELAVIAAARRAGVSAQKLRQVAEYLQSLGHNPFSEGDFLILGDDLVKIVPADKVLEAISLLKHLGQLLLPITLPEGVNWLGEEDQTKTDTGKEMTHDAG